MKTTRFVLPMIVSAVLMYGTSFAGASGQTPAQRRSQSGEKAVSVRPSDETKTAGEHRDPDLNITPHVTKSIVKHRASVGLPKWVPRHQAGSVKTQATKSTSADMPTTALYPRQTVSSKSVAVPNKTLNGRSGPVRAPTVAALSGQDLRNPRNRTANLAISGGPANSTHNTAAINGTGMKRKP
jgi:hypothetical protein